MSEMTENGTKRYKLKEVCIRLAEGHPLYSDVPLSSPTAALDVMRRELSQYDREVLCVVNLNNKLKPINFNIVSMGSINGSIASIPNILKSGILSNAYGFLLLHNHPSGDVTPSREDIQTTRRCIEAGKIMDIPCLDHVIVGGGNSDYYSFRESGMVDFTNEKISMTAEQILHVNESNSTYKGGTETMPENGRKDDLFVPDFVKEAEEQIAKGVKLPTQEEVTIKFGKGLAEPFQSKDGREFMRITIPNQDPADKTPWASFVLPAKAVHENQYGKGLWAKIPADGATVVTKPVLKGQDEQGKNIWEDQKTKVPNKELKEMVEAYKTRAPQAKEAQPRESAREKLDALVKDTAAKLSPEKTPKAKSKSKKGPEL
jgi:hypothetical protein